MRIKEVKETQLWAIPYPRMSLGQKRKNAKKGIVGSIKNQTTNDR